MTEKLAGGVAVITGAAGGIGLGIAKAAAAAGMRLVLADIAKDRLTSVAAQFEADGVETLAVIADMADPASIDRLAATALDRFGAPRLLVNNAGVEMLGDIWELTAAQWQRALDINVLGPINGTRAFAPAMIAAKTPSFIANVTSIGGLGIAAVQSPYIISKHALLSFTECLYMEMARDAPHIAVSAVLPGPVNTRIFTDADALIGKPHIDEHFRHMKEMLSQHGLSPEEAGTMIVEQIAEGRFWVSCHPEMMVGSAKARADYLAGQRTPAERVRPE